LTHSRTGLARVIGVGGLASVAINTIVGSGIFGLPGIAAAMLGPAAVLAYLVCALLIGLVGLCFAEAGSRMGGCGGLYNYATESFGPIVGGIAGTLLWTANSVIASAAVINLLVETIALRVPAAAGGMGRVLIIVAVYAVLATVNIRGVRAGTRLSLVLVVVKIAPLVLLILAGMFIVNAANLQVVTVPAASQVAQASVVLFFAFMGMEGGLNVCGEVRNPTRTVPCAIFVALLVVAVLYMGLQTVAQGVLGDALAGSSVPLVALASSVLGPWGARLLFITTLLSVSGYLAADMLGSPRVFVALAERQQLPRALAAVHPRLKTPATAIVVYALLTAGVATSGSFRQLVVLSTSGTLLLYLIGCLGVLRLRARNVAAFDTHFRAPGGPLVPLAASGIIVWLLSTLSRTELLATFAVAAASAAAYAVVERRRKIRIERELVTASG
jgi:basic amino acid/polyamine antiporter, APA family